MNENALFLISFLLSLAGLFVLFLLSESLDYTEETIQKITAERLADMVKIEGEITRVTNLANVTFLSVQQPCSLDVVIFENATFLPGEYIEVIGKGEEYEGKMEVIAHRIRIIQ
jgi:DNA/RNA endonuclease YhcR with UshA esterase domain